ncbi:MAG TPA: radical SAM protein, partial [Bacteroidales bacterium]|nr:radical SAM protein [Bacteroidales bacterium]
ISLCGGEPFLFDGLLNVVAYAASRKIRTSITSNGMTIHKLSTQELSVLKESKCEVNISLDAFDNRINSITRGAKNGLENALKSIQVLQKFNVPVTILTAISNYNFEHLSDFVKKAFSLGIRQVLFQPIIYYSNYPDRNSVENKNQLNVPFEKLDELQKQLDQILQFEKKHQINTNVYRIMPWINQYLTTAAGKNGTWFFEAVLNKFYCREIYAIIDIAYDGGIQSCGLRPATVSIKDRENKNLLELWNEATHEIRNFLETGNFYPECNGCCHHFSRNMIASMIKYPLSNRQAWATMLPLIGNRVSKRVLKNYQKSIEVAEGGDL